MSFTPTNEQLAIVNAARNTSDNLLVSALAGAAKTSTLVLLAEALPTTPILCLAFNKRIAVEMQERLPANCQAQTLNSLGHRVWSQFIGRRLIVDTKKNYTILSELIESLDKDEKKEAYSKFSDLLRNLDFGKTCGYIPAGTFPHGKRLMDDEEFFYQLDEEPTELEQMLLRKASKKSIEEGFKGRIDFSDQILLPTVFPATFPSFPLVMVDEAQDLSALNHVTLRKLVKKRLIAVGDECQSIYGFRGAHEDSMRLLQQTFKMTEYILSISFRCPTTVVEEARWRAPHMRWPEWAKPGAVQHLKHWSAADLPDTPVILCRNNAPLFSMAIKLLKNGRYPEIVGNDIGKNLLKIMKGLGDKRMPQSEVLNKIREWREAKLAKSRAKARVYDQAECLTVFAMQGRDLGEALAYAEHIMNAAGPIKMMTIHKAKGLEFDTVYLLDNQIIGADQQDLNLRYVAQTRTRDKLIYVTSEGFVDEHTEISRPSEEVAPTV